MKTILRIFIYFAMISWLGAELFFPVVAKISFAALAPATHDAGRIVAACLAVIHHEGVVCSVLIAIAMIGARRARLYTRSDIRLLLGLVVLMLGFTVISELAIVPRMHAYRMQAGGQIDTAAPGDPNRTAFEQLHRASEWTEEAVVLFGLAFIVVLTRAEGKPRDLEVSAPLSRISAADQQL